MFKNTTPTLLTLLLAAGPAFAQFEGILEMKMTTAGQDAEGGGGTMLAAVSKAGTRCEMNMQMGGMTMKTVTLQKADEPDVLYRVDDANKTYTEIDFAKVRELASRRQQPSQYTVEKLGQETLLGYKTQHVLVKEKTSGDADGLTMEMWTAKDLLEYATLSKMQMRLGKGSGDEALVKALKDAGADGVPLKSITTTPAGPKVIMEVVKVDKKSLPASTFEIPAGYTKSEGGMMGMMGGMSGPQADEAKKRMNEALKNMTPEQREMVEKMMKQRQPAKP